MSGSSEIGLWRQAAMILVVAVLLGLFYNHLGLQAKPVWGMSWIQQDRGEAATLEDLTGDAGATDTGTDDFPVFEGDDPMGFGVAPVAGADQATLPDIPVLGRPIKMQLPVVKSFYDANAAVLIDAREPDEFTEGHIAGAVSLPYDEAVTDPVRLETLETGGRPLITYCGGGTCELSENLAWSLIEAGHAKVIVFVGGYPEWVEAGYAIETGEGDQQ